jgi:hypothetical protein
MNEFYNSMINKRGKELYAEISRMMNDAGNLNYTELMYEHPLVKDLPRKYADHKPGWIDSKSFAQALIYTVADLYSAKENENKTINTFQRFDKYVQTMKDSNLKKMWLNFIEISDGKYEKLENKIEIWFNNQMASMTVDYKRKQRGSLGWVALLVTLALNIDSLYITKKLMNDTGLRENVSNESNNIYATYKPISDSLNSKKTHVAGNKINGQKLITNMATIRAVSDSLSLPIGWSRDAAPISWLLNNKTGTSLDNRKGTGMDWFFYIMGLAITVFSLSRGSPFWFEILGKFITIKRGGAKL